MGGSDLGDLWETVFAPNPVIHMMTSNAYARAFRARLLPSAVIMTILLQTSSCLSSVNRTPLQVMHKGRLNGEYPTACAENEACVQQLMESMDDLTESAASQSRTGKLWIEYLKQISVIRNFIRAQCTGDWDLDPHAVSEIIPFKY